MTASENTVRRMRRQRGAGLLETMLCISLMSLLFLGAMALMMSASQLTVRSQAQVYATGDAANALQNVMGQIREASSFSLPTSGTANTPETGWNLMGSTSLTQFSTTMPNQEVINTAIQVAAPLILTPVANGYPTPMPQTLRVLSTAGGGAFWSAGQGTWTAPPVNISVPGSVSFDPAKVYLPTAVPPGSATAFYLIYRGDANYAPDPTAGTYLWEYAIPANASFNPAVYTPTVLCKSISPALNAVQFVRAVYNGVPEKDQLEVKIISSYYSPVNGQQTNEEGSGASSSQLSGKCVLMRNHCSAADPPNASTQSSGNTFQYH